MLTLIAGRKDLQSAATRLRSEGSCVELGEGRGSGDSNPPGSLKKMLRSAPRPLKTSQAGAAGERQVVRAASQWNTRGHCRLKLPKASKRMLGPHGMRQKRFWGNTQQNQLRLSAKWRVRRAFISESCDAKACSVPDHSEPSLGTGSTEGRQYH